MNGSGEYIITALSHVDMIIRVNISSQAPAGKIRYYLVGIHIRTGAGTGLENIYREMAIVITFCYFVGCCLDSIGHIGFHQVELFVGRCRRSLD